jgi:hypothetical protein
MVKWLTMTKTLKDLLERAESWPKEAQEELVELGHEIEGEIKGEYHATRDELAGVDRGIDAANAGKFASQTQVEQVLAKFRIA